MSKAKGSATGKPAIDHVVKRTHIGGLRPKTSSMNKSYRRSYKANRGQGR
jgi:hypothetical protein